MEFQGGPWISQRKTEFLSFLRWHWEKFGFGHFLAILKSNQDPIGIFSLKYINKNPDLKVDFPDLGFLLKPQSWGNGYATEGAKTLVKYGFKELGLTTIVALNYPENKSSTSVLLKAGFRRVGEDEINYNGHNLGGCTKWLCEKP